MTLIIVWPAQVRFAVQGMPDDSRANAMVLISLWFPSLLLTMIISLGLFGYANCQAVDRPASELVAAAIWMWVIGSHSRI